MSATNHTTNYELPIFIGTDKPAWLVDWNGAMSAIDTAIKQAETKADSAGTDIGTIQGDIVTINGALTTLNGAVSQLRLDTNSNTGSINTINELIGNGTPTTTDHTLIGAINELHADIQEITPEVKDLNFTDRGTATTSMSAGQTGTPSLTSISYALNADGSIGKIYGLISIDNYSFTVGSSGYADIIDTNITVDAPDSEYYIFIGNFMVTRSSALSIGYGAYLHVKANGSVSVAIGTGTATTTTGDRIQITSTPCIYFFADFGD